MHAFQRGWCFFQNHFKVGNLFQGWLGYRGDEMKKFPTQLYGELFFINHEIRIPMKNNQDFNGKWEVFFFRGSNEDVAFSLERQFRCFVLCEKGRTLENHCFMDFAATIQMLSQLLAWSFSPHISSHIFVGFMFGLLTFRMDDWKITIKSLVFKLVPQAWTTKPFVRGKKNLGITYASEYLDINISRMFPARV